MTTTIENELITDITTLNELPLGSIISTSVFTYRKTDHRDPWLNQEQGGQFRTGSFVPALESDSLRLVMRGPVVGDANLTVAQILSLPEGSTISNGDPARATNWFVKEGGHFKFIDSNGAPNPYEYPCSDFVGTEYWCIRSIGELVEQATDEVTIPWQAITEGMYLQPPDIANIKFYVRSIDGTLAHTVQLVDGDLAVFYERNLDSYTSYRVVPHDEALINALASLVTEPVDVEARVRQARAEVEQRWARNMQQLNERAHEYARRADLCTQFDDFMSEFTHLGLEPREREYNVDLSVTGTVTITVTARDEDSAYEAAREAAAIREGSTYTLNDESFNVTDVSDDACEEV